MPSTKAPPRLLHGGVLLLTLARGYSAQKARQREPRPEAWVRAPTERGSEIPRGTLGWGV